MERTFKFNNFQGYINGFNIYSSLREYIKENNRYDNLDIKITNTYKPFYKKAEIERPYSKYNIRAIYNTSDGKKVEICFDKKEKYKIPNKFYYKIIKSK